MKKIGKVIGICALAMILTACGGNKDNNQNSSQENTQKKTLKMATEAGFAPYEYTEDGVNVVGVDVDIAKEIANELGMELEVLNMDFDGALMAAQNGSADFAAAGISITEDRKEVMDFSVEYAESRQVVVVKKDDSKLTKPEDVNNEGIKSGVQNGTTAVYYMEDNNVQYQNYNKYLEAVLDLNNGKIDCIVMDSLPAEQLVKNNDGLEILDGELFIDKYAFAVKKGNQEMLDDINKVLERLVKEGKIDEFTINHSK